MLRGSAITPSAVSSTRSPVSSFVQVVVLHEPELDRRRRHALLEVRRIAGKPVTKELDHESSPERSGSDRHCPRYARLRPIPSVPSSIQCTQASGHKSVPAPDSSELSRALGVSETTARVLVRRGYGNRRRRAPSRRRPAGHDPLLLGSMREACEATGKPSPTASAFACTATTTLTASAPLRWHPRPARAGCRRHWICEPLRGGLRPRSETLTKLAEDGCGLVLTVDCGNHCVEGVAHAKSLGIDVVVTDTTGRAKSCRLPDRRHRPRTTRSRSSVARESSTSWARRCSGRTATCSHAISTSSPWRRSPTSCRWSTRTVRWPRPAYALWREPRSPAYGP